MDEASDGSRGHFPQVDQLRERVRAELIVAVLADARVQDALLRIGAEPPVAGAGRWKLKGDPSDPAHAVHVHTTRTKRAGRIYLTHLALRGLLTYGEIDRYASIIDERRRRRQPLRPQLRPDPLVARNRPTPQTVKRAAEALATCVRAAHQAEPENLLKNEENAMYRVLAFIGIDRRSHRPALTPAAAKKRAQRERQRMAPIVAAQRERLDAEVAAGRMIRLSEFAYVNAD